MRKTFHFFVVLVPAGVFALLELVFLLYNTFPKSYYFIFILALVWVMWGVRTIAGKKSKEIFFFASTPLLITASQFLFILFIQGKWFRHLLGLSVIFLGVFLENLYLYSHDRARYQEYTMGNILSFLNILLLYLFSASFFGFIIFLDMEIWIGVILLFFLLVYLTSITLHFHSILFEKSWPYLAVISLIGAEFFWVINFLPLSMYVNAFILTSGYYLVIGVARNHLMGILNGRILARYIGISVACLILVLFTAKWV